MRRDRAARAAVIVPTGADGWRLRAETARLAFVRAIIRLRPFMELGLFVCVLVVGSSALILSMDAMLDVLHDRLASKLQHP